MSIRKTLHCACGKSEECIDGIWSPRRWIDQHIADVNRVACSKECLAESLQTGKAGSQDSAYVCDGCGSTQAVDELPSGWIRCRIEMDISMCGRRFNYHTWEIHACSSVCMTTSVEKMYRRAVKEAEELKRQTDNV